MHSDVIYTAFRRLATNRWVLSKCVLMLLLLYTVSTLLLGFYSTTSNARYGNIQRTLDITRWYRVISDAFVLPIVVTAIAA